MKNDWSFTETIPDDSLIIEKNTILDFVTVLGVKDKTIKSIKVPEGVTHIGRAFEGCTSLLKVELPNSVCEIGSEAFCGCESLVEIHIPDSVKKIGSWGFKGCTQLTTIEIPSEITKISSWSFDGCESLKEIIIPDSVKIIESYAFNGCKSLEKVVLSSSLKIIEHCAFGGCVNLNSVYFHDPNFWFDITFRDSANPCAYTKHLYCNNKEIHSVIVPDTVNVIDKNIFRNCKFITSIKIPSNVKEIDEGAFAGCSSLIEIVLPENLTTISKNLFSNCISLKDIIIPSNVKQIGSKAFKNCINLQAVTISNGLVRIENEAFEGCKALYNLEIPDSVSEIGYKAFVNCESLEKINTPNGLTDISLSNFEGCVSLKEIFISSKITKIWGSLDNIKNVTDFVVDSSNNNYVVTDDILFDKRTSTLVFALPRCKNMQHYSIPNWVTEIGDDAFRGYDLLQTIDIPNSVKKIGCGAFACCKSLRYLDIPESVVKIDKFAFAGCESLESIDFAMGTGCSISPRAFEGCSFLKNVYLPGSIRGIGFMAFANCSSLQNIVLSEGIVYLGGDFIDGTSVEELSIPDSVEEIGIDGSFWGYSIGAFPDCFLKEIKVAQNNQSYTAIDGILYNKDCSTIVRMPPHKELKQYKIEDGVKSIEPFAFYGCKYLKEIYIPNSISFIGSYAFRDTLLSEIHIDIKDINIRKIDFDFSDIDTDNCKLFVPSGTRWEYRHHPLFGNFKDIEIETE